MKKITLLIISVILVNIYANSQEHLPFPESDAIWNYRLYINNHPSSEYKYGLKGDTIINEKKYNKLYLLNDSTLTIDEKDTYVGAFRQENNQVWFKPTVPADPQTEYNEFIAYDFSKKENEIVDHGNPFYFFCGNPYLTPHSAFDKNSIRQITRIENETFGHIFYHGFYREGYPTSENGNWIEGIGSSRFFFDGFDVFPTDGNLYDMKLMCFKYKDEVIYMDNLHCDKCFCYNADHLPQSINNLSVISISITPNTENTSIEIATDIFPCYFELINLQGETVLHKKVVSSSQNIPYNTPGLYLYRVNDNSGVLKTGKIILN